MGSFFLMYMKLLNLNGGVAHSHAPCSVRPCTNTGNSVCSSSTANAFYVQSDFLSLPIQFKEKLSIETNHGGAEGPKELVENFGCVWNKWEIDAAFLDFSPKITPQRVLVARA